MLHQIEMVYILAIVFLGAILVYMAVPVLVWLMTFLWGVFKLLITILWCLYQGIKDFVQRKMLQ